ncbi:MAG: transaldolase, partial [Candidatus Heimdallarchaeota archaeon]
MNPLKELQNFGQAFWLDYIRRSLIQSGELSRLRDEDGLRGVTSNPTIFQKAIAGSPDYDVAIKTLVETNIHMNVQDLYEKLVITDIQMAADILRPIYDETNGSDGFVSLELSPRLAHDTQGSIAEARRLWKAIKRPNVMLKVPATPEGIPVIETLIAEGINTNVTLIFSLSQYKAVAEAYIRGLELKSTPQNVASVASFFLSRIDRVIDKKLNEINTPEALKYRGKTAIASAKMAYNLFKKLFSGERWESLADKDAQVQRLLWASTSTKNPTYSDVLYVEPIIGQDTVNTMPPVTLNVFREHGQVNSTLEEGLEEVKETLKQLERLNIDLNKITQELQIEGVKAFEDSFNELLSTLEEKRQAILKEKVDIRIMKLGKYQAQIEKRLEYWNEINFIRRIWVKDPTLWFSKPVSEITDRLGWLILPETMEPQIEDFLAFSEKVKSEGIRHVV